MAENQLRKVSVPKTNICPPLILSLAAALVFNKSVLFITQFLE